MYRFRICIWDHIYVSLYSTYALSHMSPLIDVSSLTPCCALGDGVPSSSIHFLDDLGLDEVIEDDDPPPPTPPPANVGIHTRLRHLMKESRKSVVMGAELSNLRSFRVRAREESQARQMQAALQWERQSNTHKYLSKRRRMNVQTIVVRNTADNHAGNHTHTHTCTRVML